MKWSKSLYDVACSTAAERRIDTSSTAFRRVAMDWMGMTMGKGTIEIVERFFECDIVVPLIYYTLVQHSCLTSGCFHFLAECIEEDKNTRCLLELWTAKFSGTIWLRWNIYHQRLYTLIWRSTHL
jgi:hypothetical protein